ncbi:MAG: hypothetical protein AAF740_12065 [Bacteroidota bacterium]
MKIRFCFLLFLGFVFHTGHSFAQADSVSTKQLLQMIEQLQKNQTALEELQKKHSQTLDNVAKTEAESAAIREARQKDEARMKALRDSLQYSNTRINQLVSRIDEYREEIEKQESVIKDVTKRVELSDEARYLTVKNNVENMMEVFELLNDKLNTLDAISQVDSYRTTLSALNNPADESMGFSYNKKVIQLLEDKIPVKKNKGRFLQIAESIIQNPAVNALVKGTPVVNIGATLMGFVSNMAVNNRDVEPDNIFQFKQELDKYTGYYVQLNEANQTLQLNMHDFQVQTKQLHSKLEEFVVKTVKAGKFDIKDREDTDYETEGQYLSYIFRNYNQDYMERYLRDLERRYEKRRKIDHAELMENNPNLAEMTRYVGEVRYLFKQFDYLYTKYIAILEKNNSDMVSILEQAKINGLSDDNTKIDRKIAELKEKKKEAIRSIRTAMNIEKLKLAIDQLDAYASGNGF